MIGSPKMYRIWSQLSDIPRRWIDVMEVGKLTNLTCRQVSALVNMMPEGMVLKKRDPVTKAMQLYLDVEQQDIKKMDIFMKEACYKTDARDRDKVREVLKPDVWTTVQDLCDATGLERRTVVQAVSMMQDVEVGCKDKVIMYRIK